jgi:hypothetical protein
MPGSEGRPAARLSVAGGAATLMTKALRSVPPLASTAAEKTRCAESGSHAGAVRSPVVRVVVAAEPVRFLTRRTVVLASWRR